jgi:hypothetical protein
VGLSEIAFDDNPSTSLPAVRAPPRALLAVCVALSPLVVALSFVADPTGGVPQGANNICATFRHAGAERVELFLFLNAAAAYLFPLSYIGLWLVALRRLPWLAALGMIGESLVTLQWGVFVPIEALSPSWQGCRTAAISSHSPRRLRRRGDRLFPACLGHRASAWIRAARCRTMARVVPRWAAALMALGVPLQALAYPLNLGALRIAGFLLVVVGGIAVALALLKNVRTHDERRRLRDGPGSVTTVRNRAP